MCKRLVCTTALVLLAGKFVAPDKAMAQMDLGGATRMSVNGSVPDLMNPERGNIAVGLSRVLEGGAEVGGGVGMNLSPEGVGGDAAFRGGYNFFGESLVVPFVDGGIGFPFGPDMEFNLQFDAGGGIKRFISETASFDIVARYAGAFSSPGSGGLSLNFGMSIYLRD